MKKLKRSQCSILPLVLKDIFGQEIVKEGSETCKY